MVRWIGGRSRYAAACSLLIACFALAGCDGGSETAGGAEAASAPTHRPYPVTTTVSMITDITRNIVGKKGEVTGLMGAGVDPHNYTPKASDVQKLMKAEIVFYNGLKLEGKMQGILEKVGRSGKPVHAVTKPLSEKYIMHESGGAYDPHIWMDVEGWMRAVEVVSQELQNFDPANAQYYKQRTSDYLNKLDLLDRYVHEVIGSIPEKQRVLVTAHDAFNYFGRAYDIDVKGIQGLSTQSEAGIRRINELRDMLIQRQVHAVFVETSVAEKNVRALIEGAQSRGHKVRIGGSLYSDAAGPAGTYEGTYIGMIDHNATTIAKALGGSAPQNGFRGWLKQNGHQTALADTGTYKPKAD
jgi:manganese/zinc/iron transport system substrate-binding protein